MTTDFRLSGDDFDKSLIEKWFEEEAAFHNSFVGGRSSEYSFFYHYANNVNGLGKLLKPRMAVLDFGCAEGLTLSRMNMPVEYHGVDASEELLKYAKERQPNATFKLVGKDQVIPFDDNKFDLIICFGVLHHIPNVSFVLKEFSRVLKPGGYVFVREPITDMKKMDGSREGLSPNERGIHPVWMKENSFRAGLKLLRTDLCFFGPLNKLRIWSKERYAIRPITWVDRTVSKLFDPMKLAYHRVQFVQKVAPNAAYFTLQKSGLR